MTEAQVRQKFLDVFRSWIGRNEKDGSHKYIIDIYNKNKPLPRNYAVQYSDEWCATAYSAAVIEAGLTDIMPIECSCGFLIEKAIEMGIWQEKDNYVPAPGDAVLYDWSDGLNYATTDNKEWADHIGVIEKVIGNTMTVIEGNIKESVDRRNLAVNGRYIRGFITPNFASKASVTEVTPDGIEVIRKVKIGDVVDFVGTKHYISSYAGAKANACRGGKARVTAISEGNTHPYHLVAVSGGGSNVYGWVDVKDIEGVASTDTAIKVGDIVEYSGKVHYTSSYAGAKEKACKGGTAKVTAINKGKQHPYHLVSAGKGCTVHGWVDADKVSK